MSTIRMLPIRPPANGSAGGPDVRTRRFYQAAAAGTIDALESDVSELEQGGNGAFFAVAPSGTTARRPTPHLMKPGYLYVDTDLELVIAWDGETWRNPATGAAV